MTTVMSSQTSVTLQRCSVARVKLRAAETDPGSRSGVRVATFGNRAAVRATGAASSGQLPFAGTAICNAGANHSQPVRPGGLAVCAVITCHNRSLQGNGRVQLNPPVRTHRLQAVSAI